jgi:hypothetical protein
MESALEIGYYVIKEQSRLLCLLICHSLWNSSPPLRKIIRFENAGAIVTSFLLTFFFFFFFFLQSDGRSSSL